MCCLQVRAALEKKLVAKSIHFNSQRASKKFEEINCSGISESSLEAEMFGQVSKDDEGNKIIASGIFERAHEGSVYLTDLAEVSLDLQAKLLQLIQDKKIQRVGSKEKVNVDIRLDCC